MNEIERHNLKPGSRVAYWDINEWVMGEVTIVKDTVAKVIFDSPSDLNYDYYPIDKLEFEETIKDIP